MVRKTAIGALFFVSVCSHNRCFSVFHGGKTEFFFEALGEVELVGEAVFFADGKDGKVTFEKALTCFKHDDVVDVFSHRFGKLRFKTLGQRACGDKGVLRNFGHGKLC